MTSGGESAARAAAKYRGLISSFINRQISAPEFQSSYLKMFKTEDGLGLSPEFDILEALFADADDYSANPEYRKYVHTLDADSRKLIRALDEEELRDRAREAYKKLYET